MNKVSRLFVIHDTLKSGKPPLDAQQWGERFGVNVRTILRDLAFLKKELGAPVVYDPLLKGYRYQGTKLEAMAELKQTKWTRLLTLIHRICAEPGQSAKELAEATGRVERTIFRDLRELEEAGLPIYNDNGYRFAADAFLPAFNLTPSELFSLFVSVRLLESQDEDQLGAEGRRALEKLLRGTAEAQRPDFGNLRESVQVSEVPEETGANMLGQLQEALGRGRQLQIHYRGMKDSQAKPRLLDPMGLFCFRQVWYLHAFDHSRQGVRNFRLSRIESAQLTGDPVKNEAKMELSEASYHKWDVEGQDVQQVRITVSDSLGRWLAENPAHPSQELTGNALTYRVTNPKAMARWVTSLYGLEVLEPQELRAELQTIAQELVGLYGSAGESSTATASARPVTADRQHISRSGGRHVD